MIDFTVVLGLDRGTLGYLDINIRSWQKFHPWLWERPWIAFYDPDGEYGIQASDIRRVCLGAPVTCVPWVGAKDTYENQREKMLSGHVYVSRLVRTEWFLKIDVDSIAIAEWDWPKDEWFDGDPVLVGPSWGYWRSKGSKYTLDEWVEILEMFGDRNFGTPRAGWIDRIGSRDHRKGPKLKDKNRWVSWLAFQRTSWVREMSDLFEKDYGTGMLPVPSHDTSLWAAAVRSGAKTLSVGVKDGWTNRVTKNSCREIMKELGFDDVV